MYRYIYIYIGSILGTVTMILKLLALIALRTELPQNRAALGAPNSPKSYG